VERSIPPKTTRSSGSVISTPSTAERSATCKEVLKNNTTTRRVKTAPTQERWSAGILNPTARITSTRIGDQLRKKQYMPIKDQGGELS